MLTRVKQRHREVGVKFFLTKFQAPKTSLGLKFSDSQDLFIGYLLHTLFLNTDRTDRLAIKIDQIVRIPKKKNQNRLSDPISIQVCRSLLITALLETYSEFKDFAISLNFMSSYLLFLLLTAFYINVTFARQG